MKKIIVFLLVLSLLPMVWAAKKSKMDPKLTEKVKALFEGKTVGVIMMDGIPTMTEKGQDSEKSDDSSRIVIKDGGKWEFGKVLGIAFEKKTNELNKGALVNIASSIYCKKSTLQFTVRTVNQMEVTRGKSIYEKKYPEYHRTTFQFKFSPEYHADSEDNLAFIQETLAKYIKLFGSDSEAQLFVNSEGGGSVEIKVGMTVEEVVKLLGLPKQKAKMGNKLKYKYDDWKITFVDGKVVEVDF